MVLNQGGRGVVKEQLTNLSSLALRLDMRADQIVQRVATCGLRKDDAPA